MFWDLTFRTLQPFRRAHEKRLREKSDMNNFQAWLTGRYVAEAVASVLSRKAKYPKEPYELHPKKGKEKETHNDVRRFMAFANALNATRLSS